MDPVLESSPCRGHEGTVSELDIGLRAYPQPRVPRREAGVLKLEASPPGEVDQLAVGRSGRGERTRVDSSDSTGSAFEAERRIGTLIHNFDVQPDQLDDRIDVRLEHQPRSAPVAQRQEGAGGRGRVEDGTHHQEAHTNGDEDHSRGSTRVGASFELNPQLVAGLERPQAQVQASDEVRGGIEGKDVNRHRARPAWVAGPTVALPRPPPAREPGDETEGRGTATRRGEQGQGQGLLPPAAGVGGRREAMDPLRDRECTPRRLPLCLESRSA